MKCALRFAVALAFVSASASATATLAKGATQVWTNPVGALLYGHYNLAAMHEFFTGVQLGPKLTVRPNSPVHGFELGVRSRLSFMDLPMSDSNLGVRAGVHYIDLKRTQATRAHETGMFTPYFDVHKNIGHYQALQPDVAASWVRAFNQGFCVEIAAGLEVQWSALHFSNDTVSRVYPLLELNIGIEL